MASCFAFDLATGWSLVATGSEDAAAGSAGAMAGTAAAAEADADAGADTGAGADTTGAATGASATAGAGGLPATTGGFAFGRISIQPIPSTTITSNSAPASMPYLGADAAGT